MSNYIIKKVSIKKAKVNYQEPTGYEFAPKNAKYANVKRVVVADKKLQDDIYKQKIEKEYQKIVAYIYGILNEGGDDDASNTLLAYSEIQRLKQIFVYKYNQKIEKAMLEKYFKKLSILEMEINKLVINLYQNREISTERKGASR